MLQRAVKFPWKLAALIVGIWLVATAAIWVSREVAPSPAKWRAYVAANPLAGAAESKRMEIVRGAAERLNRLSFDQRRELREGEAVRGFFQQLSPGERSAFLDLTLPEGFRQMIGALNKMDAEKRQRLVQRVLDDLKKNSPQEEDRLPEEEVKKVLSQGVSSFYEEASADVKLDFAPVLEQLQRNIQNLR